MSTSDEISGSEAAQVAPLTSADLDRWTAALDEDERPVAGVAGGVDAAELGAWVAVCDLRTDPGLVDLLVVRRPPEQAATLIAESRPLANMVVCLGDRGRPWPVVDAHLALIRAVTAAFVNILAPTDDADDLVRWV